MEPRFLEVASDTAFRRTRRRSRLSPDGAPRVYLNPQAPIRSADRSPAPLSSIGAPGTAAESREGVRHV